MSSRSTLCAVPLVEAAGKQYGRGVKLIDQPDAKIRLWAANPRVVRTPRIANLPHFGVRRFDSYAAFNAWKLELQLELIRNGGAKWTN